MINNRQVGRRRGRNNPRQGGGGGGGGNNRGNGDSGNRIDNRARGNAAQLLEKYRNLARDAQMAGDRVNVEYYLQFADHYFRVLADNRMRQEEQQGGRPRQSNDRDQYNGPESSDGDFMNDGMGDDMDDISPRQQDTRQHEPRQQEQRPRRDNGDEDMQPRQQDSRQQEQRPRRDQRDDESQPRQQQDRRPRNDQRDDDAQPRQQDYRQQEQRPRRDQRDDEAQPRQQQDRRPRNDQRDDEAQPRQQEQRPRTMPRDEDVAPRAAEPRPRREPREKVPRVERVARPRPVNVDADNDGELEIGLPGLPPSIARVEIDVPEMNVEAAADVAEAPVKPRRGRPPRRAAEAAE